MKHFIFSLAAIFVLALAACSDDTDGGIQKDYEVNESYTDLLQQAWKITEHEYADKSYYTRDFKTSWVINKPFSYNGRVYRTFNYKLSLQTEINYVEEVEVGTFPDGEDWIVDLKDGSRLFAIEDLHYGGNKYVMIIRDRQGNRFRCETVADDCIYFVENATDYNTLKVEYVRTINAYGNTVADIDYTIAALPRNLIGAYAVLVEGGATGIELKLTASNGNAKLLTSNGLGSGWCRGEITSYDLPGEDPEQPDNPNTGDRDTEMEKQLFGAWVEPGYENFIFYYYYDDTYIVSFRHFNMWLIGQSYKQLEVTNGNDGRKITDIFVTNQYSPYEYMVVGFPREDPALSNWVTLQYIKKPKAVCFKNKSSYKNVTVKYKTIKSNTNSNSLYLHTETGTSTEGKPFALIAVDKELFNGDWTVNAEISAYNDYNTDLVQIDYTYTVPSDAPDVTCIEITDAFFHSSEDPESPEYDTEIAEALFGSWISDNSHKCFFNYYHYNGKYPMDYRTTEYPDEIFSSNYSTPLRVKKENDGTTWVEGVYKGYDGSVGVIRFFEIRNFKARSTMEIRPEYQKEWIKLSYQDKSSVFFIENGSSTYKYLRVIYEKLTGGIDGDIALDCMYVADSNIQYAGMLGINGWLFPYGYTVKARIQAYRSAVIGSPSVEFDYTYTVPANSMSNITHAIITDADIPY